MRDYSRRQFLLASSVLVPAVLASGAVVAQATGAGVELQPYPAIWLPAGIRSRFVNDVNGLRIHVLEAGYESSDRPALLLLHGFPELAYSWRRIMLPLAEAGYHVIAPDVRGYGRTTGWSADYDTDLAPFRRLNKVRDALGLVAAFGYESVAAVIGHDAGAPLAGWCALTRPDIFKSVVMMSAPFGGTSALPFDTVDDSPRSAAPAASDVYADLANLPRPRKHYQRYYRTREANENMWHAEQGIADFIRGYYHFKSADWEGNQPHRLAARTAQQWALMPEYYIMNLNEGMADTVAAKMPSAAEVAANGWLPDDALAVYAAEYGRTSFQGGLNGYRMGGTTFGRAEVELYSGKTIDQPSMFISGASDWGTYQSPGSFERMQERACTDMRAVHLIDGAGHWVQQEQAEVVSRLVLNFLENTS
jgi:pimeloyl-ACP methyl ester carboxylesterase